MLRGLIRNRCVNDGTAGSGWETRNAELLLEHLTTGSRTAPVELTAPPDLPQRGSLVARLEGTDPDAPTLLLLAHTDVVPVEEANWSRDPFAADLVDGEVWGRGAVDMLNQTAAMAVAFRRIAARPTRPKGTLIFAAVADEEAGGHRGVRHLLATRSETILADAVLTEAGGTVTDTVTGPKLSAMVGEKGMAPTRIVVHGRAGHGSLPLAAQNALVTAAEVIRRIAEVRPPTHLSDIWRTWVEQTVDDDELRATLLDADGLWDALPHIDEEHRTMAHACTHSTFSPTQIEGSAKNNIIPGRVVLDVDVRLIGDETPKEVEAFFEALLHDLPVDISIQSFAPSTRSSTTAPIWSTLERAVTAAYPDGGLVPSLFTGGTDGRYFRARDIPTFGFGVLSRSMPPQRYWSYFHGHDERIDIESLRLSTEAWERVALDYLDG